MQFMNFTRALQMFKHLRQGNQKHQSILHNVFLTSIHHGARNKEGKCHFIGGLTAHKGIAE